MVTIRNERMQGATGLLKVVVVNGVEVGMAVRHSRTGRWIVKRGIGEQAVTVADGITTDQLAGIVNAYFA